MLHMAGPYEPGCPTVINGIPVNTYRGVWTIDAWQATLNVKYYWSGQHGGCITYLPPLLRNTSPLFFADKEQWESSAGRNRSVPVAAVMEGEASIAGRTDTIKVEVLLAIILIHSLAASECEC